MDPGDLVEAPAGLYVNLDGERDLEVYQESSSSLDSSEMHYLALAAYHSDSSDNGASREDSTTESDQQEKKEKRKRKVVYEITSADLEMMYSSIRNCNIDVIEDLLKRGYGVNSTFADLKEVPIDPVLDKVEEGSSSGLFNIEIKINHETTYDDVERPPRHFSLLQCACFCGHSDVVDVLLLYGADIMFTGTSGDSPLFVACMFKHVSCVHVLLEWAKMSCPHFSDIFLTYDGETILHNVIGCYWPDVPGADVYLHLARELIRYGCDVNHPDKSGKTGLHLAAAKPDSKLVEVLLSAGARVDLKDNINRTPLILAIAEGTRDNVETLLSSGSDINVNIDSPAANTSLAWAVEKGREDMIKLLLSFGAEDPHHAALERAVSNRFHEAVLYFLEIGFVEINYRTVFDGFSLVLRYTQQGSLPMVKEMLERGANPNMESRSGTTPIWEACRRGNLGILRYLLAWNCDLDIVSLNHFLYRPLTPVQVAMEIGYMDIVKLLWMFGCQFEMVWLNDQNADVKRQVREWVLQPRPLKEVCMITIRRRLGINLPQKVKQLELPTKLQDYVMNGSF